MKTVESVKISDKFRIIEKTNLAGFKRFFPQVAFIGHNHYKTNLFREITNKRKLIKYEDAWCYLFYNINEKKFETIWTKGVFDGRVIEIDFDKLKIEGLQSMNDAMKVIEEYKIQLKKDRSEYNQKHFDNKKDKIHTI